MAGLFDLPEKQAPPDPDHEAAVKDYRERQQELEEADGLKDGILRVLEQGLYNGGGQTISRIPAISKEFSYRLCFLFYRKRCFPAGNGKMRHDL